ncbi:MAG: alpha/beta fold hydrolase [Planktomarina sp.]
MSRPPILYFHGMPGGETEVSAFGPTAFDRGITAVRRTEILWRTDDFDTYLDQLADWVSQTYPDQRVHLVGFSLGAMTVLRLLNRLGDQVMQVDLISPAAPLEMGNF